MTGRHVMPTRIFVAFWVVLSVAGALNHTIIPFLFGKPLKLWLPHLKYGFVMFDHNDTELLLAYYKPRYAAARLPIADLIETPSLTYKETHANVNLLLYPPYLEHLCWRGGLAEGADFFLDHYDVQATPHIIRTDRFRCESGKLDVQ